MTWGGETYTLTKLLSNASIIYKNILGDNVSTSLLEPCKVKNPTKTSRMSRENCPDAGHIYNINNKHSI